MDEALPVYSAIHFGVTAKMWRADNPEQKGNIRDYASLMN